MSSRNLEQRINKNVCVNLKHMASKKCEMLSDVVARIYKERKRLRVAQQVTKRAKKRWKILKGTIICKSTDPIKIGGRHDHFYPGETKDSSRVITLLYWNTPLFTRSCSQ
jgi:hypothetical protein